MDQRTEEILEKIIVHFIENAEPIGSRMLSKVLNQKLSPATIRNVMSDLSEMGFIEQPHTSAGRIPTDAGYRYYINKLLQKAQIPENSGFKREIADHVKTQHSRLEDILLDATNELSTITNCTGIVISPKLSASKLKQIQLVRLSEKQILVVLVTQIGMVHNKVIQFRSCPAQTELNKLATILLGLFEMETITNIRKTLINKLTTIKDEYDQLIVQAIRLGKKIFDIEAPGELFISGRSKMCSYPEFYDQHKLAAVYRVFEDKTLLTDIMVDAMDNEGIKINIGTENHHTGLNTCSVVAGTYGNQGYMLGSIGIVGPTRLNYPNVITAIHYSSEKLSFSLSRFLDTN
jgi:heat-inducible transcriptional repressor